MLATDISDLNKSGSGIGGLTLAVALSKLEVDNFLQVDIYESTAKLTQVGAGIMMWPRGWEIIQSLGLQDSLAKRMPADQELPSPDQLSMSFLIYAIDSHLDPFRANIQDQERRHKGWNLYS